MAGRIAGITIEIGGDASGLQDALKDVDKQLGKSRTNLRDINKLLKLNPGNVKLLAQKQKNLNNQIKDTKKRLDMVKEARAKATKTEDIEALDREIISIESDLEYLEAEYKKFGSVGAQVMIAAGDKIKGFGNKLTGIGTSVSKYVTAPIVAVGAAAYKAFTEVDEGLDTITLATGATGEALDDMGEIMKNIATDIPTDFKTAGDAIGAVNTRFGVTGDKLEELSTLFIEFASINGVDVVTAVNEAQKALAAYGLSADDAAGFLDTLSFVAQGTGISVDTLMSGIVQHSAEFKEMGLSIDQAAVFMGQLEMSGVDANTAMSGLSKALKKATKDGKPFNEALAELQDSILNGTDSTDGLTAAYDLFGKSGAQIYDAVKSGTIDFNNLATATTDAGGTVTNTFNATLDPADKFKTVMNAIKVVGADIAENVMPILQTALEKVQGVVETLTDKWNGLSEEQQNTILKVAGIVAAVGPVLTIGGKLISGIGLLVKGIGAAVAVLGGPLTAAIAAAIAIGALLIANWDEVKTKCVEMWESVKGWFSDGWQAIKDIDWSGLASSMWDAIKSPFVDVATWFKGIFTDALDAVKTLNWGGLGTAILTKIKSAFDGITEWFKTTFKKPINAVIKMLNSLIGKAEGGINTIIGGINSALSFSLPSWLGGQTFSVNIPSVSWKRIPELANGGIVKNGGMAIVGEYAPEYLRVVNGRAIVTPMDRRDASRYDRGEQNITINIYEQPGQSAAELANAVQRVLVQQQRQRVSAYA